MFYDDTIAAIATPPGEGGIGIVRISGNDTLALAQKVFRPFQPGAWRSHRVRYGHIIHPDSGHIVDEALALFMQAPRSFTREDVVELSCHGGPLPVQQTLELALRQGARLAEPGEFTLRAFLNGRIDLTQAEATLDIIRAQTNTGLALAEAQLGGWLAKEVRRIRSELMHVLAYITVTVDFPEDEVEPQDSMPALHASLQAIETLLATSEQGIVYRQGARVVLVGRPNVGKSSLLNILLRTNRAIVSPIPGTTRDTLEETANVKGIPVVLIDTAGITDSADMLERLGVERSRTALEVADLVLLVFDSHEPLTDEDIHIAELTYEKPTLIVWNKADLAPEHAPVAHIPFAHPHILNHHATSVVTGAGIDDLVQEIARVLLGGRGVVASDAHLVTNPRHRDALHRAVSNLQAAIEGQERGLPTDLMAGDVTTAMHALGEITGETVTDDLLNTIFSSFCIGK